MRIGLVGCGKVGTTLFYLLKKNNKIIGVYDINKKNQKKTLRLLNIKKNPSLKKLCTSSEALFVATPDDRIINAYQKAKPFIKNKKHIFHFSGILSSDIFPKSKNIYHASVHPFATFPKILIPPASKKYFLFIEGDPEAQRIAKKIFSKKYFILKKINECEKIYYHLVGVFASNLIVGLSSAVSRITRHLNWKDSDFARIVIPIIDETINNIKKYGIKDALSGPLERGDIKTIKEHLRALKNDKVLLDVYKSLSLVILQNIPKCKNKREIEKLLKK